MAVLRYNSSSCELGGSGSTALVSAFASSASARVTVPFSFRFGGVEFANNSNGGVFVTSKGYIAFGRGVVVGARLNASNPAAKSVLIAAADSSWQRLYVHSQATPVRRLRVRFEGYSGLAQLAAPNVIWEASFWPNNTLSVCVGGTHALAAAAAAVSGVSDGAGRWLAQYKLALRSLYLVNGLPNYT